MQKPKTGNVKLVSESLADMGGFKEAILEIQGESVYSKLKFEAGVHRVQRVPVTESRRKSSYFYCHSSDYARSRRCRNQDRSYRN